MDAREETIFHAANREAPVDSPVPGSTRVLLDTCAIHAFRDFGRGRASCCNAWLSMPCEGGCDRDWAPTAGPRCASIDVARSRSKTCGARRHGHV